MTISTVSLPEMKERVRNRTCPECGAGPFTGQGLSGHLRMTHNMEATEAKVAMKRSPAIPEVVAMNLGNPFLVENDPTVVRCGGCDQLIAITEEVKSKAREGNDIAVIRCPTPDCDSILFFEIDDDGHPVDWSDFL